MSKRVRWSTPPALRAALAQYVNIMTGCTSDERAIAFAMSEEGEKMKMLHRYHGGKAGMRRLDAAIAALYARKSDPPPGGTK